ncbi:DUF554 domain-containing protein [Halalkalibacterium halodurans]|uniref:DUF554 domain-containing protein n=1 Tax=Halalkalibacterium halodurans TaxID=86665 RepID=A0A0M0KDM0_ALKHA|nr:DUF554 domain-containing protein [Halalkalibacterium halodurans]MDY7224570.1 DUF554 domain-containing protein [Halalkalibacterium halodurans]MDY7243855.1 DUF554 domain-containing protein [Halalkalibacterium halodurans]MED3647675.1 DUF554 domain-containing protein [Halalkalibacterium halodurans]MED4123447.1 DUF554 domain-containing protein [Halalkalibacterium halodurans]TES53659.1 DUF554 domain-containing protein [Halalkalibacterium halodurans]
MVLIGTVVNGAAIVIAALIGLLVKNIPERVKTTVMQAIGLAIVLLGVKMGLQTEQFLIVICSLVIGGVIGEILNLEKRLDHLGRWIERKVGGKKDGSIATAFVTTTLIYVVGAMAVLGALDSGLRGDHSVLLTKALLDGFLAILFTSTLGIGVLFSAIPVVLYQGSIALFASQIDQYVPTALMDSFITEMSATGGVMIVAIGLNLLNVVNIRVANLLPSLVIVAVLVTFVYKGFPF